MPEVSYRSAAKVQVLAAPRLAPGHCCICGSSDQESRDFIDMGWEIDFFGVVYICTFCFSEVVNILGCLTKEQSEALEHENNILRQRIVDFQAKELAIHDAADKLRASGLLDFASSGDSSGSDSTISSGPETLTEYYERIKHPANGDSGLTEQNNLQQRRDDVSSSESDPDFTI